MIPTPPNTSRESFTIPRREQGRLKTIQDKFSGITPKLNKSEIIRIGIHEVEKLSEKEVKKILENTLGRLSVGKPSKSARNYVSRTEELVVNEQQWRKISAILPKPISRRGRPSVGDREVINGILFIFRYETQRRNIPEIWGSHTTCWRRLNEFMKMNLWKKMCSILLINTSDAGAKELLQGVLLRTFINSTNIEIN